jgi:hypothetical protein
MKKDEDSEKADKDKSNEKIKLLKSKLKDFDELQKDYELTEEHSTLLSILRRLGDALEGYIKIIIQLLQPEEFHSLHECTAFDDEEKEKLFDLYKDLMIIHREILKAEVENDEDNSIATIAYVHTEMKKIKPDMMKIIQKMQESWKNVTKRGKARYFG